MLSVLGRYISEELGEQKYFWYFDQYRKWMIKKNEKKEMIEDENFSRKPLSEVVHTTSKSENPEKNEVIFNDIYQQLKNEDIRTLSYMLERMLDAINTSLQITKRYIFVVISVILASIALFVFNVMPIILVGGIVAMIILFLFKTYEFILNRFCYIDAHILLVYKSVLFQLILTYDLRKLE